MKSKPTILLFSLLFLLAACTQGDSKSVEKATVAKKNELPKPPRSTKSTISNDLTRVTYKALESKEINGKDIKYYEGKPFTGVVYSAYKNAQVFTEQEYRAGIKDGAYATWFPDGKPKTSGAITADGKEDGEIKQYYESGQIRHIWIFNKGVKEGQWEQWYENGQKWTQRDFNNGVLNGKVYVWGEDGVLGKEYTYVDGNMTEKFDHFENN